MIGTRVAVVGAGLAGSVLAWRLAAARPDARRIDLFTGDGAPDATEVSGGLVRGFETDPAAARLAALSLTELTGSGTLRRWARFRQIGSVYLCADRAEVEPGLAAVNEVAPGSALALPAGQLGAGWAGLPAGAWAVVERRGGYIRPNALRGAVLSELRRRAVRLVHASILGVSAGPNGEHRLRWREGAAAYDSVVFATGARTGELLDRLGLPAPGLRTKLIQYGVYRVDGRPPPAFIDDTTGLYGRADGTRHVLLGVPSDAWDPPAGPPQPLPELQRRAEQLAAQRFPHLGVGRPVHVKVGADCYAEPGHLALRPVAGIDGIHTFTGGSGGSVKLALAAGTAAAFDLENSLSSTGVPV